MGKLMKLLDLNLGAVCLLWTQRKFRISAKVTVSERRRSSPFFIPDRRQKIPPRVDCDDVRHLTGLEMALMLVDRGLQLAQMRDRIREEADAPGTAAVAQIIAEAEAAWADAVEAVLETIAAEAEAEVAEAAWMSLKGRNTRGW